MPRVNASNLIIRVKSYDLDVITLPIWIFARIARVTAVCRRSPSHREGHLPLRSVPFFGSVAKPYHAPPARDRVLGARLFLPHCRGPYAAGRSDPGFP